jgi:hypothetical protein
VDCKELQVKEQARQVSSSIVYVALCGDDSTAAATFLPRGSSLLVFCDDSREKRRLERDVLNNIGFFQTRWMTIADLKSKVAVQEVTEVIRKDMESFMQRRRT